MKYSTFDSLEIDVRGPVGWLINNRPDQLNAMTAAMRDEFAVAWKELDADPDVRVIVHTGNGRAFQTGVDVTEIATDGQGMQRYRESVEEFDLHFTAWHQEVWKPVITAVNGICAGGGFHWVADADIVIAASDAQFFDPHVSVGQVVSIEAIGLIRKMPFESVMRMALVGRYERMSAPRAYELGMISQVVDPPEELRAAAQQLAETIARNSPAAMAATKRALGCARARSHRRLQGRRGRARLHVGPPRPGRRPRAFAEKREPNWQPPKRHVVTGPRTSPRTSRRAVVPGRCRLAPHHRSDRHRGRCASRRGNSPSRSRGGTSTRIKRSPCSCRTAPSSSSPCSECGCTAPCSSP